MADFPPPSAVVHIGGHIRPDVFDGWPLMSFIAVPIVVVEDFK